MTAVTGTSLREIRHRAGLSQKAFAARLGISDSAVARWERDDRHPSPARVRAINATFGADLDVDGQGRPATKKAPARTVKAPAKTPAKTKKAVRRPRRPARAAARKGPRPPASAPGAGAVLMTIAPDGTPHVAAVGPVTVSTLDLSGLRAGGDEAIRTAQTQIAALPAELRDTALTEVLRMVGRG